MQSTAEAAELVAGMSLPEKASLCSGTSFWKLQSLPAKGLSSLMVADGPLGLRKQEDATDHLGAGGEGLANRMAGMSR